MTKGSLRAPRFDPSGSVAESVRWERSGRAEGGDWTERAAPGNHRPGPHTALPGSAGVDTMMTPRGALRSFASLSGSWA